MWETVAATPVMTRGANRRRMEDQVRLLLADDHKLVREALSFYLRQAEHDLDIVQASDLDEARQKLATEQDLDIVILDLRMPGMNGLAGLEAVRRQAPGIPVIILSGNISQQETLEAVSRGAAGVISKDLGGTALVNALRLVLSGEIYIPSPVVSGIAAAGRGEDAAAGQRRALGNLSARELDVLRMLTRGCSNRRIADELGVAETTVKMHLRNAFEKLGARNRVEAVRVALNAGVS